MNSGLVPPSKASASLHSKMRKWTLRPRFKFRLHPQISRAGVVTVDNVTNSKHTLLVDKDRHPAHDSAREKSEKGLL